MAKPKAQEPGATGKASREQTSRTPEGSALIEPAKSAAQILAASSQEFRDPLQSIRGALELMIAGKVPDRAQMDEFLGIAFRETEYLSHRVSDLHVASMIEAGKLRLKPTTLDFVRLLNIVVSEVDPMAADKAVKLAFAPSGSLPVIRGDETLLHTLLTNLMEAGIQATPREGTLQIRADQEEQQLALHLSAAGQPTGDQPAGELEALAHNSLALYVADRIAVAHEGFLTTLGTGAEPVRFELTLPIHLKGRGRGRVLVIDDNPQAAVLLEYALQGEGFEAVKAMNGPEGLQMAKTQNFDLVILDVLLPGIDGFEVCHRLRSSADTASLPIIMISAKARDEDRATAMRIGADAYFGKPLGMAELMLAIEDLLESSG